MTQESVTQISTFKVSMRSALAFALPFFLSIPAVADAAPKEKTLYVQVRESKLRAQPQFWAPTVQELPYGTALTALSAAPSNKSWLQAKVGETQGFVHVSAVTSRKIVINPSAKRNSVQSASNDIVLAGKGFNKQVENNYGSSKGLDFAAVDELEKAKIDPAEEVVFIREGDLVDH